MTNQTTYRITKRAFGTYTEIEHVTGWQAAMERSMALQFANKDGEYLVKELDEPNWVGGSSYQSPMDWL
jgi:hypothetical protein